VTAHEGTGMSKTDRRQISKSTKQKRMENLRRERGKMEVILTTRNVSDQMKKQLGNMNEREITKNLQQAVERIGIESIKIRGVRKISNHELKIQYTSDKETEEL